MDPKFNSKTNTAKIKCDLETLVLYLCVIFITLLASLKSRFYGKIVMRNVRPMPILELSESVEVAYKLDFALMAWWLTWSHFRMEKVKT